MTRFLTLVVVCLCLLFSAARAAACSVPDKWQRIDLPEDDLLISLLRLNGRPLVDGIDIYPYQDTFLVPVTVIENALKLGWQIDLSSAVISARQSDDGLCSFELNLGDLVSGDGYVWSQDAFDLYLDVRAVALLIDAEQAYNFELLQLNLTSDVYYPGLKKAQQLTIPSFASPVEVVPARTVEDEYHTLTPPLVNYRLGTTLNSESDDRINASVNAAFDLLGHAANLRVNTNNESSRQFLRLSRNVEFTGDSSSGQGLTYELGDIQLRRDELINRSKQSLGVAFYSNSFNRTQSFTTTTIEEIVLPGWRAQLFRNGQFVAELLSDQDNRVLFEDVETFYGNNLFEIKLYGPEGQQETRTRNINVGNEQLGAGQFGYYLSASDDSRNFIDGDDIESPFSQRLDGSVTFGLTDELTLQGGIHRLSGLGVEQNYLSSSLIMSMAGAAIKAQVVSQEDAGQALFVGWQGELGNQLKLNLSGRYFDDFFSDAYTLEQGIESELLARLNGRVSWLGGTSWGLTLNHRGRKEADNSNIVSFRVNQNLMGGTFSSTLTHDDAREKGNLSHQMYYSKNIDGWQLSGALEWLLDENFEIDSLNANLRWPQKYNSYNETRLDYRPSREYKTELRHQYNWRHPAFNLALGGSINDGGEWTLNFSITGDIEYDPFDKGLNFYQPRGSSAANIRAFAYLDNNRNAVFDENDSPLSDVVIGGSPRWRTKSTGNQGHVQLTTNKREQPVKIESASLPDPYMQPVDDTVYVRTHKGGINTVSLPVVTFNDIEGAVYRVSDGQSRGASALRVSLVDESGQVVAQTDTEIDGYFYIDKVPPGDYQIQVDPEYLAFNNLTIINQPEVVNAPSLGDSIRINDLLLASESVAEQGQATLAADAGEALSKQYFVQLGVFKKSRSLFEVIKHLPVEHYDLNIFRDHNKALSYVVMGGFDSISAAQQALSEINHLAAFKQAFVVDGERYLASGLRKEAELKGIDELLHKSHKHLKSLSQDYVLCQLASYQSITSFDQRIVEQNPEVLLLRRQVNGQRYYTLATIDAISPAQCQSDYQSLPFAKDPFATRARMLVNQLL